MNMSAYDYEAVSQNGREVSLEEYKGQVALFVNTASKCGLTPQYEGLQKLYVTYKDQGFTVLGFPCNQFGGQEPGTDEEIQAFCSLNYQVTFPMFAKIDVNGPEAHPLYKHLREQAPVDADADPNSGLYKHLKEKAPELLEGSNIRWNFTKFLVDRDGNVVKRYAPTTTAADIEAELKALL
jgi:glutathione peroxidase